MPCETCKKNRNVTKCSICGKETCHKCGLNVGSDDGPWVCQGGGKCHFITRQELMKVVQHMELNQ